MNRRLEKLSAPFRPNGVREFTLEDLCRLYWRMDKRGFRRMVEETPMFRFFLECFEREDRYRDRQDRHALAPTAKSRPCARKQKTSRMKAVVGRLRRLERTVARPEDPALHRCIDGILERRRRHAAERGEADVGLAWRTHAHGPRPSGLGNTIRWARDAHRRWLDATRIASDNRT